MVGNFMRLGKRFVPAGCSSVGDRNKDSSLRQPFRGLARRNRGIVKRFVDELKFNFRSYLM